MGSSRESHKWLRLGWPAWSFVLLIVLVAAFFLSSWIYRRHVGLEEIDRGIGDYGNDHVLWVPDPLPPEQDLPVRILSLDAGGIRGILELFVLAELEKQTGQPIIELFDLVVGSSTGSVIGASLLLTNEDGTPKYSAQEILDNYVGEIRLLGDMPWYHRILTLGGWIGPRYSTTNGREWVLRQFGQATLADLRGQLAVATVDIDKLSPRIITSRQLPGTPADERAHNYFVGDVILAATAAPTIIPPMLLRNVAGEEAFTSIDGGIFAHNPSSLAVGEAVRRFPGRSILLLSLGTGSVTMGLNVEDASSWGLIQWARVTEPMMFNPRSRAADQILAVVAGRAGNHLVDYLRINPTIPEQLNDSLFESPSTIAQLTEIGQESVRENRELIKEFSEHLKR